MKPTAYKYTVYYGTFFTEDFAEILDEPDTVEWTPLYDTDTLLQELAKTLKEQQEDYKAKCNELEVVWEELDKCRAECDLLVDVNKNLRKSLVNPCKELI